MSSRPEGAGGKPAGCVAAAVEYEMDAGRLATPRSSAADETRADCRPNELARAAARSVCSGRAGAGVGGADADKSPADDGTAAAAFRMSNMLDGAEDG
jgi:hypothetical protein